MENDMPQAAITDRSPDSPPYKRHRPEQTLLYHIIEGYYPAFRDVMVAQGKDLPLHVQQEFADYLKCGRLERSWCMPSATGLPDIWNDREFLKEMKRTVT